MTQSIAKKPKTEWVLVKVPSIRDDVAGANATARVLRETIREHHFGGEKASAVVLTKKQIDALSYREPRVRAADLSDWEAGV